MVRFANGTLKNQLRNEAEGLGSDTESDVTVKGKTADHDVDLIVKSSGKVYIVIFGSLPPHVRAESMYKWIFDAVDILRDKNEKIIFVYLGNSFSSETVKALSYYYDMVIPFDKFGEYISNASVKLFP